MKIKSNRSSGSLADFLGGPPYPEIAELAALHDQLRRTKSGTKKNIELQSDVQALKDALDARGNLFHRLTNAHDRERLLAMIWTNRILEGRFFHDVNALLQVDLTFDELSRLGRLISEFDEHFDTGKRLGGSKPTSKPLRRPQSSNHCPDS